MTNMLMAPHPPSIHRSAAAFSLPRSAPRKHKYALGCQDSEALDFSPGFFSSSTVAFGSAPGSGFSFGAGASSKPSKYKLICTYSLNLFLFQLNYIL